MRWPDGRTRTHRVRAVTGAVPAATVGKVRQVVSLLVSQQKTGPMVWRRTVQGGMDKARTPGLRKKTPFKTTEKGKADPQSVRSGSPISKGNRADGGRRGDTRCRSCCRKQAWGPGVGPAPGPQKSMPRSGVSVLRDAESVSSWLRASLHPQPPDRTGCEVGPKAQPSQGLSGRAGQAGGRRGKGPSRASTPQQE